MTHTMKYKINLIFVIDTHTVVYLSILEISLPKMAKPLSWPKKPKLNIDLYTFRTSKLTLKLP